ncbi:MULTISPECIES: leucyl aminopeptidase [Actinoalloteichus]|uniref:Probable cytosol aminopeptidase n=1 Tax=Actinoalloteichus fjordicus TaxID=1612552 RepID=A0AAC9LHI7_9PSEU|nr:MULTISPECIES: leucyl aminopeptidase [Actinoalloteichus]APU17025.1 leucyl aminopeptidase [Actinoalloteichus fjordicus]APU23105.1 leucyl aminopeptidase [Actinoalloteichus sp. GBA129-24]
MSSPTLAVTDSDPVGLTADALIIGTVQGTDGATPAPGSDSVDAAFPGGLAALLTVVGATGRADEVVKIPTQGRVTAPLLIAVGLGKADQDGGLTAEQVRRASGAAARALGDDVAQVVSTLSTIDLAAAAQGTALGAYRFDQYKSTEEGRALNSVTFARTPEQDGDATATLTAAAAIAKAVNSARDLVNTPPNDLFPESFAQRTADLLRGTDVDFEVLDEQALARDGYGGILGVGAGSSRPPRLLRLRYKGPKAGKKVALVGKGVTFDSGGISLKPAADMHHMTSDMAGAAAVVAVVVLAAELGYPLEITATVPLVENLPSGTAYRPGDVLTMFGGKTVEVLNTDAEGRLILADAITRAAEDEPDYLIETSTLTGAQVVALGKRTAGIMGSDDFRDRVAGLARATGEGGWAMPLPEELRGDLDSKLADLANITGHRWGGMLAAGIFLREFVAEGLEWAHIDIAGPSYNDKAPWGYTPKGGTGVPVRTIAAVLADIAEQG